MRPKPLPFLLSEFSAAELLDLLTGKGGETAPEPTKSYTPHISITDRGTLLLYLERKSGDEQPIASVALDDVGSV